MFNILDKIDEFNNSWNYTFIAVSIFAILIGAVITILQLKNKKEKAIKNQEELLNDETILRNPENILKKK